MSRNVLAIYAGVVVTTIASSAWGQVSTQKNTETGTTSPSSSGIVLTADSATAEDRNRMNDGSKIVWPEKHSFKSCFRTDFTTQVKGRTYGKPSTWVSQYQTLSTAATDENYVFCFSERGVSGSAMYSNGTWIYFQRNHFGRLHGDIKRGDGNVTRFIYFHATGADYAPIEGVSTLYVVLNAKQAPGDNMNPNVIVLTGRSTLIPVAGQQSRKRRFKRAFFASGTLSMRNRMIGRSAQRRPQRTRRMVGFAALTTTLRDRWIFRAAGYHGVGFA